MLPSFSKNSWNFYVSRYQNINYILTSFEVLFVPDIERETFQATSFYCTFVFFSDFYHVTSLKRLDKTFFKSFGKVYRKVLLKT